jgi:3-carboxy-cis,cis-muconate cycloisomerase
MDTMSSRLIYSLATTDALDSAFSDRTLLQAMFDFEAALAVAEARAGLIPQLAAEVIGRAAVADDLDVDRLVAATRSSGTASIAVVDALVTRVERIDPAAAAFVHRGATSQDVFDTALILCLRAAWPSIEVDHARVAGALDRLAGAHADSVMLGRTLLQPATPTTFGLKAAGWAGAVSRGWRGWSSTYEGTLVLQFGGAAGTLAALGADGTGVEQALADELDLAVPDAPWHAHRDRLAAFVASAGIYGATLGKIARDITLLMQDEVREVSESGGGSSTMPHKRNPSGCAAVIAASIRLPGLVGSMLSSMDHEHERGVGGWHAEAPIVVDVVRTAGAALSAMAHVLEHLTVDAGRMRNNVDATRGVILAERVSMTLMPIVGRREAAVLVKRALDDVARTGRTLSEVISSSTDIARHFPPHELLALDRPEAYLGSADTFRRRLGQASADVSSPRKR